MYGSKFCYQPVILHKAHEFQHSTPSLYALCILFNTVQLPAKSDLSLYWHMFSMHIQCFLTAPEGFSIYAASSLKLLHAGPL